MKTILTLLVALSFTSYSHACAYGEGFLPKNDMNIPDWTGKSVGAGGITQSDFNSIIDKAETIYAPIVRNYGGNLYVERLWSDGKVNAFASRQGSTFKVQMYGGLARHEAVTRDGFALVVCHEIGHHIGGVPRYRSEAGMQWASTEGQSDYFATTKCLRKLFRDDDNEQIVKNLQVDATATKKCEAKFSVPNDIAICKRIAMAGYSGASLFSMLRSMPLPKFNQPDPSVVNVNYDSHPDPQCRLDTYYQGGICEVQDTVEIGQNDPNVGTCNRPDSFTEGLRPLCWYKPTGDDGGGDPPPTGGVAKTPTVNGQTSVSVSNPNQTIPVYTDVSGFSGVKFVALEFSKANKRFSNPNSTAPDKVNGLRVEIYPNITGTYNLIPMRHLPGWGQYQMRVIGLDQNKKPVSKNSNSLEISLRP